MPLASFFDEQLSELKTFIEEPGQVVRIIGVDRELRAILLKMMIGLDQ
ncbi:MAG: hypothetical protein ACREDY_01760 [Bradyrhizobium sp.]